MIVAGDLVIDRPTRRVHVRDTSVILSAKEFELVAKLASEPNRVFTKEDLLREVWGYRALGRTRTLESHASRVRKKLCVDPERSVRRERLGRGLSHARLTLHVEVESRSDFVVRVRIIARASSAFVARTMAAASVPQARRMVGPAVGKGVDRRPDSSVLCRPLTGQTSHTRPRQHYAPLGTNQASDVVLPKTEVRAGQLTDARADQQTGCGRSRSARIHSEYLRSSSFRPDCTHPSHCVRTSGKGRRYVPRFD